MTDSPLSFPDQPRVDLDRRLADLVSAANEVLATQGRLRALLRANQAITAGLDLPTVLRTIVEAVRDLTGAEYVALGVLDEHGGLEQFIHTGMSSAAVAQIGDLPHGKGLLGALITDARPIRLDDISHDPRSAGFPAAHPPMKDFLGVPVRVRGIVFGNLYLTNHPSGSFSEEDEQLVRSLAATAGFAVDNARLYRETQRREAWIAASAEVTGSLLTDGSGALTLVVDRVRSLTGADHVIVALLEEDSDGFHVVGSDRHESVDRSIEQSAMRDALVRFALEDRAPRRFHERELHELGLVSVDALGPVMTLPLDTSDRVLGAIVVARAPGSHSFTATELNVAADYASRTGVALELHRARSDQERVTLFEDRGRIARDLHDRVIQQLFATGMQLQGVLGTLPEGRNASRVDAAITSLDAAISQIRRIIFTLSTPERAGGQPTGRHRLLDLVGELAASLSVEPAISFVGAVDAVLDANLIEDVLAVVSEGVTNAVKHADATDIAVVVAAIPEGVVVTVTNDGRPFEDTGRRSGLANLEERARRRGGQMRVTTTETETETETGAVSVLSWSVPPRPAVRRAPPVERGTNASIGQDRSPRRVAPDTGVPASSS